MREDIFQALEYYLMDTKKIDYNEQKDSDRSWVGSCLVGVIVAIGLVIAGLVIWL